MDQAERHAHPDLPRCVVVYESMFGNTEEIASAVADGLSARFDVEVCNVNDAASDLGRIALLVVGAPTHAFGMSRRDTRRTAGERRARQAAAQGIGVREWLAGLQPADPATVAVAFDTRIRSGSRLGRPGDAATPAATRIPHADQGDEVLGGRNPRTFTCWGARSRTSLGRQPRRQQPERGEHPPVTSVRERCRGRDLARSDDGGGGSTRR